MKYWRALLLPLVIFFSWTHYARAGEDLAGENPVPPPPSALADEEALAKQIKPHKETKAPQKEVKKESENSADVEKDGHGPHEDTTEGFVHEPEGTDGHGRPTAGLKPLEKAPEKEEQMHEDSKKPLAKSVGASDVAEKGAGWIWFGGVFFALALLIFLLT